MEDEKKQLLQQMQLCRRSKSRLQNLQCYSRNATCDLNLKSTFLLNIQICLIDIKQSVAKLLQDLYRTCYVSEVKHVYDN